MMILEKKQFEEVDPETGEITTLPPTQPSIEPKWFRQCCDELMGRRFISGTPHDERVEQSLRLGGNSKIFDESSLLAKNQEPYVKKANILFQKKFTNLRRNEKAISLKFRKIKTSKCNHYPTDDHSIARKRLRLITIIHSVTALNVEAAVADARQLIKEFTQCLKQCKGISCYAVVEAEVISYRNMKSLQESKTNIINAESSESSEYDFYDEIQGRKFTNTGILGVHLGQEVLEGENGQICIHLHGLLVGKNEASFEDALKILRSNKSWHGGVMRIEMKKLTKVFLGQNKPVTLSLSHLAQYFFKGGTVLNQGNPSLHYKISAPNDQLTTYEEYMRSESKYDDFDIDELPDLDKKSKKYTTDFLSLSRLEINILAQINYTLVNLNDTKTGHIIKTGHW